MNELCLAGGQPFFQLFQRAAPFGNPSLDAVESSLRLAPALFAQLPDLLLFYEPALYLLDGAPGLLVLGFGLFVGGSQRYKACLTCLALSLQLGTFQRQFVAPDNELTVAFFGNRQPSPYFSCLLAAAADDLFLFFHSPAKV